jgi:hypothetical protein
MIARKSRDVCKRLHLGSEQGLLEIVRGPHQPMKATFDLMKQPPSGLRRVTVPTHRRESKARGPGGHRDYATNRDAAGSTGCRGDPPYI